MASLVQQFLPVAFESFYTIENSTVEHSMSDRSYLFYIFVGFLIICTLQGLLIGGLYFLKRSGKKQANAYYGLLLITFSLTLAHQILKITGFFDNYERLYFLPIYFTLSFPTLLFYHVKFTLYPNYKLRLTDIKHFILPIGQFLFFLFIFITAMNANAKVDRHFYNPFFGAFEQAIYLTSFFAYMYFAYRYIVYKRQKVQSGAEAKQVRYLEKLVQILFFLFCIHTLFVVIDFVYYEFFDTNLRSSKIYAASLALSFAALLLWLSIYGFQVLFWGRKIFKT